MSWRQSQRFLQWAGPPLLSNPYRDLPRRLQHVRSSEGVRIRALCTCMYIHIWLRVYCTYTVCNFIHVSVHIYSRLYKTNMTQTTTYKYMNAVFTDIHCSREHTLKESLHSLLLSSFHWFTYNACHTIKEALKKRKTTLIITCFIDN